MSYSVHQHTTQRLKNVVVAGHALVPPREEEEGNTLCCVPRMFCSATMRLFHQEMETTVSQMLLLHALDKSDLQKIYKSPLSCK